MSENIQTSDWLKAIGAKHPARTAASEELVLGELSCDGYYPIEWAVHQDYFTRNIEGYRVNFEPMEVWRVLGIETKHPLNMDDCLRILERCKGATT